MLAVALSLPADSNAQLSGVENGEWRYLGGDAGHMRPNPHLTQIHAENVSELGRYEFQALRGFSILRS